MIQQYDKAGPNPAAAIGDVMRDHIGNFWVIKSLSPFAAVQVSMEVATGIDAVRSAGTIVSSRPVNLDCGIIQR